MARYDVHRNPEPASRERVPFVLDVQSDLLADLPTRLVAPLYAAADVPASAPRRLCPSFEIDGRATVLYPHEMAGIPAKLLGRPVGSLKAHRAIVVDAIDAVLSGS